MFSTEKVMMRMKLLLLINLLAMTMAATEAQSLAGCPDKCGDVDIPYPFGVGVQPGTSRNCFLDQSFNLTCDNSTSTLYFDNITVSSISLQQHQMDIFMLVSEGCYNQTGQLRSLYTKTFTISSTQNKFVSVGCDTLGMIYFQNNSLRNNFTHYTGCVALCYSPPPKEIDDKTCSGTACCQVDIPVGINNISFVAVSVFNHTNVLTFNNCSHGFIVKHDWFHFSFDYLRDFPYDRVPVVLDWSVSNVTCRTASRSKADYACKSNTECVDSSDGVGYKCICKPGFEGNPYHPNGCHDVDECSRPNNCSIHSQCINLNGTYKCVCPPGYKGIAYNNGTGCSLDTSPSNQNLSILIIALGVSVALLAVFTLVSTLCWARKQRTLKQLRERNFEQNGGNILLQQLSEQQGYTDRIKIFTEVELKNATNNFDQCRILGRGGQGTVYDGILQDNRHVAIKKSRIGGDPRQIKDFINEVFVLSQINHRNVVKLLGCCLETEVPLLVYEFVDNGTLLDHIDPLKNEFSISWETRLRIAVETAEAISYLHSSASIPIIHRDIKSTNILLDHNLKAKVSDFGASRLVPLDETHVTTVVQGTLGYLDPEYLHTGQFDEKSDVYSFGVVLVELLTGKKAVQFSMPEQRNLAMYFVSSMKEDRLWEILDKQVYDGNNTNQLKEVALLAWRCVKVKGEERPTMKEVAKELEGLVAIEKHPWVKGEDLMSEESEYLLGHVPDMYGATIAAGTSASYDTMLKDIALEIADGR
ncbi:putative wall-associated receptor kinase-like 16 [Prosopis cineraria]|uniref:putative wall-associated receptor kinase-like 16 n=1 Tax=Prosopis cineraria TaxID=364024 RepID=UPI00240F105D|nr:putative wall-associated receptor kinase-like 16 [Prosopis cineraria]